MLSGSSLTPGDHGIDTIAHRPRQFTAQFRQAIVAEIQAGTPLRQVARCHNLGPSMVYRWKRKTALTPPRSRNVYSPSFIHEAVTDVRNGTSRHTAAKKRGISWSTLNRWLAKAQPQPNAVPVVGAPSTLDALEQQLQALLGQYRVLHTRIERIRQLVVAA